MTASPVRLRATRLLAEVMGGRASLSDRLHAAREGLSARDGALLQALVYGSLRQGPRLQYWLDQLLERPLKKKDELVGAAIMLGFYQLAFTRVPAHAAVSESVETVRALRRPRAAGLVNALLRRFEREQARLQAAVAEDPPARWRHPHWLIERIRGDWPQDWPAILEAGNGEPPLCLRVHQGRAQRQDLLARFEAEGIAARPGRDAETAIVLEQARPVEQLPGFEEGLFSVQDESAQLVAGLMALAPGQRVLDACAAPGGKTAHLLEACPELDLLALDVDGERLGRVAENLSRLGLKARLQAGDATRPEDWWDGKPFDRILLDVPCSGTGVIRRHPDIKYLRRAQDIPALQALQRRILASAWRLLAPGGRLVYTTCSLLREENEAVIEGFLAAEGRDQARAQGPALPAARAVPGGAQRLPAADGGDGFFYAVLGASPSA